MRPYFLALLVLVGTAVGQTTENHTILPTTTDSCDKTITFGKSTKAIKDIFPDECGEKVESVACYTGSLQQVGIVPKIPSCDAPEPPDVPAVKVTRKTEMRLRNDVFWRNWRSPYRMQLLG